MHADSVDFPFRRAWVGLDDQGLGAPALEAALDLAQRLGARLELLHALENLEAGWLAADEDLLAELHRAAEGRAREHLEPLLAEVEARHDLDPGSLVARLTLVPGPAGRVLSEAAGEGLGALLFLGPHARRGLVDLGRTARRVLVGCRASIWLQPVPYQAPRSILCAVDLSREGHSTLVAARSLAQRLELPVRVLHALVPTGIAHLHELAEALALPEPVIQRLRARTHARAEEALTGFEWQGVDIALELVDEDPRRAILERQAADRLTLVGTRGQTGLGTLPGNVAWSVLREARGPVLAVRHAAPRHVS